MSYDALEFSCGPRMIPVIGYGEAWYVPLKSLSRALGLDLAAERKRLARLLRWWEVTTADVVYGYRRSVQPCLLLERVPSYLAATAASRRRARRDLLERVLLAWQVSVERFLLAHDRHYALRVSLGAGADAEAAIAKAIADAVATERRLARSRIAANASLDRRILPEQFREIKTLKAGGMGQAQIARTVGVSKATVSLVVRNLYHYAADVAGQI